jgi:hypothetical protein
VSFSYEGHRSPEERGHAISIHYFLRQCNHLSKSQNPLAHIIFVIFETSDIMYSREATVLLARTRIQEAMRYDKLRSSDDPLVMSIMRAVSQGFTQEQWKTEQQSIVRALREKPADQQIAHADAACRYEQTIAGIKDLAHWPW